MATGNIYGVVGFSAVGGILFGLDQGNWGGAIVKDAFVEAFCSGAWDECHDAARLPAEYAWFLSLGSSLVQLGAAVGALGLAPYCAGRHGRREAMFLGSLITIAGCLPQACTTVTLHFLAARFVAGVGVGVVTYALPMFISEVAPAELRGALGCAMQLTMVAGTVAASLLNCQPWFDFRLSFAMPALPAVIVAAGIFAFPVSPRFALMQGQRLGSLDEGTERAWKSLRLLRGSDQAADEELQELRESFTEEQADAPWSALWRNPSIRRRVLVANMLQWLQQLTGVNAILSYGPAIFQSAGVPLSSLDCAVVTNSFNLIGTGLMVLVIDRWGRRTLLLLGALCMLGFMSLAAFLAHAVHQCAGDAPERSILGWCLLGCVCLYMWSFAIAWGGVPWIYPSEIFPMSVKEKAMSTSVCSQWVANFLIAFVIPQQVQAMKVSGTFLFYAACLALAFCLVHALVPETRGLALEEMDALFGAVPPLGSLSAPLSSGSMEPRDRAASLNSTGSSACSLSLPNLRRGMKRPSTAPHLTVEGNAIASAADLHSFKRHVSEGATPAGLLHPRPHAARIHMGPTGAVAFY